MSKFSYFFTMQICKLLPHMINFGPNILNSALVEPSSVMLPPLDHIIPCEKSLFNWLLEGQENERVGNRHKLDYVAISAHSPLHCIAGQWTPAWIMHMGRKGF